MPREGVPYPERLLCSLRCELKNIWNALSGKLHSVNGVEGDGQGNVDIVSGDAAVVVTPQPLSNQVEISLDQSQLPAADVNSVNGQTGVVVLNADDIPSDGSSDVQADIDALKAADTTLQGNITAEATARGNADSTLQTNINASNLRISNIENAISADPDPDTIGLRDANGRLKAADPASGATDKTLVTANWASQTGDSAPNNILHRTGVETKAGTLKIAAYESLIYDVPTGGAPALNGNTAATQRILDQYINTGRDGNVWMVRNTIYQSANTKGYSRILYLRRYDNDDNIMQVSFTFTIDANGKARLTANDNDGTSHVIL